MWLFIVEESSVKFPACLRLPLPLDLEGVADELAALPDTTWTAHFVPQHYSGSWDVVPLRAPAGARHPILRIAPNPGISEWEETAELASCPRIERLIRQFACPLGAVRLMRLAPGALIHEHCDPGMDAEQGEVRMHVPLSTNPQVDFRLNGVQVPMGLGECWYLRLDDPHSVANRGLTPRIHLVIDATMNAWLRSLMERAQSPDLSLS